MIAEWLADQADLWAARSMILLGWITRHIWRITLIGTLLAAGITAILAVQAETCRVALSCATGGVVQALIMTPLFLPPILIVTTTLCLVPIWLILRLLAGALASLSLCMKKPV